MNETLAGPRPGGGMQDFANGAAVSVLSDVLERLRSLFFRCREEQDLDEELRSHVEMESERGLSARDHHRFPQ
jgi:hypothetical protein